MNQGRTKKRSPLLFVTGTDTGVGKTILTCFLIHYLIEKRCQYRALKPFCSGTRQDAERLRRSQNGILTIQEINPFYSSIPLAPLAAKTTHRQSIHLGDVLRQIHYHQAHSEGLIVEGIGGVMVPLFDQVTVLDLIQELAPTCTLVVAPNRLGVINHSLLTVNMLQIRGQKAVRLILVDLKRSDLASHSNASILRRMLPGIRIVSFPYLGLNPLALSNFKKNAKKIKNTLAQML